MKLRRIELTFKLKLILSFAGIVLVMFGMVLFNVMQVKSIQTQMIRQNEKTDLKTEALELKSVVQDIKDISLGLMISRNSALVTKYNEKKPVFNQMIKKIGDTATTSEQQQWRSKLIMASTDYLNSFDQAIAIIQDKTLSDVAVRKNTEYLYTQTQTQRDAIFTLIDNFYNSYAQDAQAAVDASNKLMSRTAALMLLIAGLVFVTTIVIAYLIIRSFITPVQKLQKAVLLISQGDLRHKINSDSRDELGELSRNFDKMVDQVSSMMRHTRTIASSLSDHSQSFRRFSQETAAANANILKAIEEISAGADQQAAQSERSSHIISDLEQEIQAIWASAQQMLATSRLAESNTGSGTQAVYELNEAAMHTIRVYDKVSEAMRSLSASSAQIGKIIGTITDISTQTNVLSLNAAIEATRAGAEGKGFSVIAEEVRQLSQQTNEASKTIAQIIRSLQKQIHELEQQMNDTREVVNTQNGKVEETLHAFDSIRQSIGEVVGQIEQVNEKVEQARTRNQQLVESIQFVAAVAEETAAGVEEVNSTSIQQDSSIRQIADQADDIHQLSRQLFEELSRFRIEHSGRGAENVGFEDRQRAEEAAMQEKAEAKLPEKEKELVRV